MTSIFGNTMSVFSDQLTWVCSLILSSLDFVDDLFDEPCSEEGGAEKSPRFSSPAVCECPPCSDSPAVCDLPDAVILEILFKLPIESIVRFRYVCKSWHRLIREPYFTRVYFKNNPPAVFAISEHLTVTAGPYEYNNESYCDYENRYANYVEIGRKGDVGPTTPLNFEGLTSPVMGMDHVKKSWKRIIGSYDGLLCLVETPNDTLITSGSPYCLVDPDQAVSILNPLIGESVTLPKVQEVECGVQVVYGFGSTADGEHYKVVRVAFSYCVFEAHILTIGVDEKWRDLDISNFPSFLCSHGITLNGVLHFIGSYGRSWESHATDGVIYAFDIGKETGHYFALPCAVRRSSFDYDIFLTLWDGHLCVTYCDRYLCEPTWDWSNAQFDFWIMKQYGVVESWSRDITLRRFMSEAFSDDFDFIPITTMRNGELMISNGASLFSFCPVTKKFVELECFNPEGEYVNLSGCAYTPSFLSPWNR